VTSHFVSYGAPVLRTDFSDDPAWAAVCAAISGAVGDAEGPDCVSDPEYDGLTVEQLVALGQDDKDCMYAFVVDRRTMTDPEMPVLVVDLNHEPGRTFRVVPSELGAIDDNLSIANMHFFEFADNAGPDGVFRGFR
jgi:hypothetical protein